METDFIVRLKSQRDLYRVFKNKKVKKICVSVLILVIYHWSQIICSYNNKNNILKTLWNVQNMQMNEII